MDSQNSLRSRFTEWLAGHILWEIAKLVIACAALWVASVGGARLMHATIDTALNLFLVAIGLLGVSWGIGLLPVKKSSKSSLLHSNLKSKCDDLIVRWQELDRDYQNSVKKESQSPTLPDPMDPSWRSYGLQNWLLFRVGELQALTNAVRQDLRSTPIFVEQWEHRISMPRLLAALKRYSEQLD